MCITNIACSREGAKEKGTANQTPGTSVEQVMTITAAPVATREVRRTVEMVGTLTGWEEVTVSNEDPGTIEKILVDLGDKVKKGQRLILFDQREAKLAIAQADANLQAAQKAVVQAQAEWRDADLHLKRMQQLHGEGIVATSQLDVAKARFRLH
jgi:HlyD family secretion protein